MKCSLFFVFLFFLYLKWLIIRVDVKKFKKMIAEMIQKIAKHTAILACGAASHYGGYQTREPKNIYKR